jgi:carboxyl-terminal processing protease
MLRSRCVAVLAALLVHAWASEHVPSPGHQTPAPGSDGRSHELARLADRLGELDQVIRLIARHHPTPPAEDDLWAGASRGIIAALGDGSVYLDRDTIAWSAAGEEPLRHGYGLAVEADPAGLRVLRVVPGSAADRGGLRPGDRITAVDGEPARSLRTASDRLVVRVAGSATDIVLVRGDLRDTGLGAVSGPDAQGIAVLAISRFFAAQPRDGLGGPVDPSTASHVAGVIHAMSGLRGLILDLRGNGGGNLQAACDTADLFVADGALIREQSQQPSGERVVAAQPGDEVTAVPVAVLVDAGTASAAEALAAALQDRGRAAVIGAPTRGKDTIQRIFLLPGGDGVALTVARILRADGRSLAPGVTPDIAADGDAALARAREALAVLQGRSAKE